jgi:molecular chaperone DnaK
VVEGESASPDDCSQLGRCSVRHLPQGLPPRTPIDVLFHYQTDGRLKVKVSIPNTEAKVEAEFARENSLSKDLLDGWRRYISGAEPTDYA